MSAYVTATDAEKNLQVRLRLKSKSALITQVVKVIGREDESERMEAQGWVQVYFDQIWKSIIRWDEVAKVSNDILYT